MSDPLISVITPSFNQGDFIERTILSVLNQNYPRLEYIIIDGGSTDNSIEIIKKYENRIAYWISEKDSGQSEAINKGFKKATGDIICWINSDDMLLPGALKKIAHAFNRQPDADVVMGWTIRIDSQDKIIFTHIIPKQLYWFARRGVFYFDQQSWAWKRNMFEYLGYLDETAHACMDIEFFIRQLISKAKIIHVNSHLGAFRQHEIMKTKTIPLIWENDRNRFALKYKLLNYQHSKLYAKLLYRMYKVVNLNYLLQFYLNNLWGRKNLSEIFKF